MSKATGRSINRSGLFLGLQFVMMTFLATQVFGAYRIPASAVVLWPSAQAVPGKQVFQRCITPSDTEWCYFIYLPTTYDSNGTKKWPLLIFQEVAGALYNDGWNNQNINAMFDSGRGGMNGGLVYDLLGGPSKAPYLADRFITLAPFASAGMVNYKSGGQPGRLMGLYRDIIRRFKVDTTHISMMGDCAGGGVVWGFAAAWPKFPSCMALFSFNDTWCSTVDLTKACQLKNIPYKHYANKYDNMVPIANQQAIYDAIVACGGTKMEFINMDKGSTNTSHEIWGTWGLDTVKAMYDWMLSNSTGGTSAVSREIENHSAPVSLNTLSPSDMVEVVGLNGQVLLRMQVDAVKLNTIARTMKRGVLVIQVKHADNSIDRILMPR